MGPGFRVVSREISEEFGGGLVVEASQAGTVVVGDEGVEVGIAFGMVNKAAVVGGAVLRHAGEMLAETTVEALDHAVGLRPERLSETVGDGARGAEAVERVLARGSVVGFAFFVDGEAVGELGAVVGQDGVDREREAVEKALEESGGGGGAAIGEDFEIDKAGGAIDRDIGVAAAPAQGRQVFDIDMDEAGRVVGLEGDSRRLLCGQRGGEIVAFEAAVHAAARQLGVEAAPHRLDDVIKRQRQAAAQFEDQGLFPIADRRRHAMRAGRTVDDIGAGFPARHGAGMDAELLRQRGQWRRCSAGYKRGCAGWWWHWRAV